MALAVISNSELRERFAIRRAALHAIRESARRVLLANPYFVPDFAAPARAAAGRRAGRRRPLAAADGERLDACSTSRRAPSWGCSWRPASASGSSRAVVHTKVLAVDDVFVSIGSYNFDHRSLSYNLEMVVNVIDPAMANDAVAMLDADIASSEELTRDGFGRRPLLVRLLERLAYAFRKWL